MQILTKLKLLVPILYAVVALIFFVLSWPDNPLFHHFVGVLLTALAFVFWLSARLQLGDAFSVAPEAKFLVQSGIYSKLRHPIYYFSITAVVGIGVYLWSAASIVPIIAILSLQAYRIRQEEKLLEREFGADYVAYKKSTWF